MAAESQRAKLGAEWAGKGQPRQRQVDGGVSNPVWPEAWVGEVRQGQAEAARPLLAMSCAPPGMLVRLVGCRGHGTQGSALISKEATHCPFQQTLGVVHTATARRTGKIDK